MNIKKGCAITISDDGEDEFVINRSVSGEVITIEDKNHDDHLIVIPLGMVQDIADTLIEVRDY